MDVNHLLKHVRSGNVHTHTPHCKTTWHSDSSWVKAGPPEPGTEGVPQNPGSGTDWHCQTPDTPESSREGQALGCAAGEGFAVPSRSLPAQLAKQAAHPSGPQHTPHPSPLDSPLGLTRPSPSWLRAPSLTLLSPGRDVTLQATRLQGGIVSPRSDREHAWSPRLRQAVTGENYSPCFMRAHKEPAWSARPAAATRSLRQEAVFLSVSPQAPLHTQHGRVIHPSQPALPDSTCKQLCPEQDPPPRLTRQHEQQAVARRRRKRWGRGCYLHGTVAGRL